MHYDMKHMGKVARKAREDKGLTQAALAEKIDISLRTIIAIENGKKALLLARPTGDNTPFRFGSICPEGVIIVFGYYGFRRVYNMSNIAL